MAEDGQREREAVEGAAGLAVAAWKQQSQRRRRRLWRGTPEHPDPHGASRGGYLNIPRVRQLDAPQKRPPGLHAEQDQLSLWWCGRNLGMDMTRKHKD